MLYYAIDVSMNRSREFGKCEVTKLRGKNRCVPISSKIQNSNKCIWLQHTTNFSIGTNFFLGSIQFVVVTVDDEIVRSKIQGATFKIRDSIFTIWWIFGHPTKIDSAFVKWLSANAIVAARGIQIGRESSFDSIQFGDTATES